MSDPWEDIINEPDRRFDKESPVAGRDWLLERPSEYKPENEYQALMEAPPNAPPEQPETEHDRLAWIVENELSYEEKAVIEVIVFAGHSVRGAAEILGWPKSTVHRIHQSALSRIERLL